MSFRLDQENFAAFFECPFSIYPPSSPYVSPYKSDLKRFLDAHRNPLFLAHGKGTYFTLHEGNDVVGRITAHVHEASNQRHNLSRSYFGFFDCADDQAAANMLLGVAEEWGASQGCNEIAGNFNLTAMQQMGVLTDGFEQHPYIDQIYSPGHIYQLLEAAGYERFFPMTTFEIDLRKSDRELLLGTSSRKLMNDDSFSFRHPRKRQFEQFVADAGLLLNTGFNPNPMFVPLTDAEFRFQTEEMIWIMDERISMLAYHDGKVVGIVICIPDLNPLLRATASRLRWTTPYHFLKYRLNRKRAVMIFASALPEYQNRGLSSLMTYKIFDQLAAGGYKIMGTTWVGDTNKASLRFVEKMGGVQMHRAHVFRKALVR